MNETRKQIIELIWDYMDKTKTKWCLYSDNSKWFLWVAEQISEHLCIDDIWMTYNLDIVSGSKTLWHYDITAVLKYIWDNHWECSSCDFWLKDLQFVSIHNKNRLLFTLPNKPLHLYTEQEEKQLLELLQKLWTT